MTQDSTRPGAAEVRAAAADLTAALGAHLSAVERMTGEQDPAVQAAYDALRTALSRYDDLLFDSYGEVTPYRVPGPVEREEAFEAVPLHHGPPRLGVVARWEFVVEDGAALAERALEVWDPDLAEVPDVEVDPMSAAGAALGELVDAVGTDTVAASAHEYGLAFAGSTLWVLESALAGAEAVGDDAEVEDWRDEAFDDVEPDFVVFRADVHANDEPA
jgi:hypothetical protein